MQKQAFCEYSIWKNQDMDYAVPRICIDAHLHLFDFLHESDGLETLVAAMDSVGVKKAVLFGMPMIKLWNEHVRQKPKPAYMYNDSRFYNFSATDYIVLHTLEQTSQDIQSRFFPFVCGFNTSDLNAGAQLERLLRFFPQKIYGIGELMSRHDDLSAMTYGEMPRADHPALLRILDIAAENDLPVLIHHNMADSYIDDPIYLSEMEKALCHNRSTRVIWAHIGVSRRIELSALPDITEYLLAKHDNLFFDISWLLYDKYIMLNTASLDRWCRIFESNPERFVFGTDAVGHWDNYRELVSRYHSLFNMLPEDVAERLAFLNIWSLLPAWSRK